MPRARLGAIACACGMLMSGTVQAQAPAGSAQGYPSKSIRMVVGFAPGGATDIIARIISPRLGVLLGQQIVIDNRPGADALLAMEMTAKVPADGYTLLMNSSSHAINQSIYKSATIDAQRDFTGIFMVGEVPSLVLVHPSLPVKNVRELIQLAKARKGELLYAASASSTYLATELLIRMAGVNMVKVAYKGGGPATVGLLSGEVQVMVTGLGPILPHVNAAKVRAIAATTMKRTSLLPNVPTVHESGLPGYESGVWYAMFAPAGTPRPIIDRLHAETLKTLNDPDVKAGIAGQGIDYAPSTKEELDKYVAQEIRKWSKVTQDAGIKLD